MQAQSVSLAYVSKDARPGKPAIKPNTIARNRNKKVMHHYGLTVLKPTHRAIRKLKRQHSASVFGHRAWETSWLLIDFIKQQRLPQGLNILDVGCGWGLAGIFCAMHLRAQVTCLDADDQVFPYLRLHAETNRVDVTTVNRRFEQLTEEDFQGLDVIIGGEICFWDSLVDKLSGLIGRATDAGVGMIVIADPGRTPFESLEADCLEKYNVRAVNWRINRPYVFSGRILRISAMDRLGRKTNK
jgi:predicted nicotinamide N-methyase